jgi:hypothetical protein
VARRIFVLIAVCALVVTGCSDSKRDYSSDTEGTFMEACTVNQGQPGPVCKCTYDEIAKQIPFDRYVELDKELQADPTKVPDEVVHIVADCGSRANNSSSSSDSSSSSSSSSDSDSSSSSSSSSSGSIGPNLFPN